MPDKYNIQYTRKSTEDKGRQVQSHEDQKKENMKMALSLGEKIDYSFSDSKSAKEAMQRPDFTKMMELIYSKKVNNLYCWRINRLARNMVEAGMVMEALQKGWIQQIITPERTYSQNDNVLLISIDFGIAKEDIKKLSSDVKRGLNSKVSKGWRPGRAPLGYINDKFGNKGEKKIFRDPSKFQLVRMLWDKALEGKWSYMDIVRYGQSIGLTPNNTKTGNEKLSKTTVISILSNPFYYGYFYYKDELMKGEHEAMITSNEFHLVQKIFKLRNKPREHKHLNLYNGLFKCGECGFAITPEPPKIKRIKSTGEIKAYKYWRCTHKSQKVKCSQKTISEEELTKQINEYLQELEIDPKIIQWALKYIETYSSGEIANRQAMEQNYQENLKDVQFSLDRLTKLYINSSNANNELLTEEEFIQQKNSLQLKKNSTLEQLELLSKRQDMVIDKIRDDLSFCKALIIKFNNGEPEEKQQILTRLARTMTIKDRKVHIESKIPFLQFRELKKRVETNSNWLEITEVNKYKNIEIFETVQTIISG